jgi:hypothetical protein
MGLSTALAPPATDNIKWDLLWQKEAEVAYREREKGKFYF